MSDSAVMDRTATRNPGAAASSATADVAASTKIAVDALDFFYGKHQVLHNIGLTIEEKRITALIGPSGCGKSTFLRTINRMNDLIDGARMTGSIRVDGTDIYARGIDLNDLRKRVGMVFQKPNPFPMSIFDNVAYGPRIHGERNRKALAEIVEKTLRQAALWDEVKDKLRQPAWALSGGQQQRLCIARVLAVEPDVLLMDEPASALDPNSTYRIEELMRGLKERYTIVIVTHNLQQAARVSDNTVFFLRGELKEWGTTEHMFTNPVQGETEDYIRGRFG